MCCCNWRYHDPPDPPAVDCCTAIALPSIIVADVEDDNVVVRLGVQDVPRVFVVEVLIVAVVEDGGVFLLEGRGQSEADAGLAASGGRQPQAEHWHTEVGFVAGCQSSAASAESLSMYTEWRNVLLEGRGLLNSCVTPERGLLQVATGARLAACGGC